MKEIQMETVYMNFKQIYSDFSVSFEVFPPKTEEGDFSLFNELELIHAYKPAFVSVTYGAGGSTRDKTFDIAARIKKTFGTDPLVHFTCVGAGCHDIKEYLEQARKLGIKDILALRGDPPEGNKEFIAAEGGFRYADELVSCIKDMGGFSIAVAGYPEKHPEAKSMEEDLLNLKRKIDAGAELVITQFFFDNDDFYRYQESVEKMGCDVPIIPGMLPVTSLNKVEKFAYLTGTKIPSHMRSKLESYTDAEDLISYGVEYCAEQCEDLKKKGVKGFHMYCLNKSYAACKVLDAVGIHQTV